MFDSLNIPSGGLRSSSRRGSLLDLLDEPKPQPSRRNSFIDSLLDNEPKPQTSRRNSFLDVFSSEENQKKQSGSGSRRNSFLEVFGSENAKERRPSLLETILPEKLQPKKKKPPTFFQKVGGFFGFKMATPAREATYFERFILFMGDARVDLGKFKEPIAIVRMLEIPLAILAFATTCGYDGRVDITYKCPNGEGGFDPPKGYAINFEYPFAMTHYTVPEDLCNQAGSIDALIYHQNYGAASRFFVACGCLSLIYGLLFIMYYINYANQYETNKNILMFDFVVSVVLCVSWLVVTCAWAGCVSGIAAMNDPNTLKYELNDRTENKIQPCSATNPCQVPSTTGLAPLNVSLIVGFACSAIWGITAWFVYKESALIPLMNIHLVHPHPVVSDLRQPDAARPAVHVTPRSKSQYESIR